MSFKKVIMENKILKKIIINNYFQRNNWKTTKILSQSIFMNDIIFAIYSKVFKIHKSEYAEILKQVHDKEFEKQSLKLNIR
jgi:hypothetical protein